jgi:hypothetical protein
MTDMELARHQATWRGFTNFVKWGIGFLVVLLSILAWTLV